jgi:CheY-like chemotaxis protein
MQMKTATILIVEDELVLREVNQRWMEKAAYRVLTAENGATALDALKANHVDLIVTDVQMPVMVGLSLIKNIHANGYKRPKIIVVTANAFALDGQGLSVDGMLQKPYERDDLVNLVRQTLGQEESRIA